MRKLLLLFPLVLGTALPARAQDAGTEYLKLARTAMQAKIKEGDAYLKEGKTKEAVACYEDAVGLFKAVERRLEGGAAPAPAHPPAARKPTVPPGKSRRNAVQRGLHWLATHQDQDGKWDCDHFMKHDPPTKLSEGAGNPLYDVGVSSLALMAFLGSNHTDRGSRRDDPYAHNVRQGLLFLLRGQDADGCFSPRVSVHYMYNHILATTAMCQAYALTRNPLYRKPAQNGLDFIAKARNPYLAWRYNPRGGENDTSVTGWAVLALSAGRNAGLEVDLQGFKGALKWVDKVTDPDTGKAGYQAPGQGSARPEGLQDRFPAEKTEAMTATAIGVRLLAGQKRSSEVIRKGSARLMGILPQWRDGYVDMDYWLWGSMATFHLGGGSWRLWNDALKTLLPHQAPDGSWPPDGVWGPDGGRIFSTAMMTLVCEIYYRYDKSIGLGD